MASIAFDRSNAKWAKPKPLYKQKEQIHRTKSCAFALFLLDDIFAVRMRYNLVSLGYDIPRCARCDMI